MKHILFFFFLMISVYGFSQQTDYVDFKTGKANLVISPNQKEVKGHIAYTFKILKEIDSVYLNANNFHHIEGLMNEKIYNSYDGKYFVVKHDFKPGHDYQLDIGFVATPKKAMYFIDWPYVDGNKQVWTQGQGKYTSNWLPSFDDMNEKVEFDLDITFDKDYEIIANGKLTNKQINDSTVTWSYNMKAPMSSYLLALAIGKYDKKTEYSKSGIPLEMYYYPKDSLKVEPTYRYTKQMFDFLEEEIGVPYPWQNYKQVPVKDFLYAGMENTSTTIFSDAFVIDSIVFVDKNYVNVNAHELAHQWFGDLVTETSGTHHWLHEGFATYYALLAEKEVLGEDYYYWRLYEYAQELLEQDKAGNSTSLLNPKSSSITFYKKGAWVLHMLREKVGTKAFKEGVKNYLFKHQFKNVKTDDFLSEVEKASGLDLSEFANKWLVDSEIYFDNMLDHIKSNKKVEKMNEFDEMITQTMVSEEGVVSSNFKRDLPVLKAFYADFKIRDSSFKAVVEYKSKEPFKFYRQAFYSKDIKVRQAIAQNLTKIPVELKADYESLLNDKSYATIEAALLNLWVTFPEGRNKYLSKTKGIIGFNDKNIRILWLTLALITENFEDENKAQYFKELTRYTSSKYGFEVRQSAFQYLNQIQACNSICKNHLKEATMHHNWRFKKFAKTLLKHIEQ